MALDVWVGASQAALPPVGGTWLADPTSGGGGATQGAAAALTASSSLTGAGVVPLVAGASLTSSSTLSDAATLVAVAAVPLAASSTLMVVPGGSQIGAAALTASSSLTVGAPTVQTAGAATLVATSSLSASGTTTAAAAAALSASSALAATATATMQVSAALSATTALSASATLQLVAAAALTAVCDLTATGQVSVAAADLTARSVLSASGVIPVFTVDAQAHLVATSSIVVPADVNSVYAQRMTATSSLVAAADVGTSVLAAVALTAYSVLTATGGKASSATVIRLGRRTGVAQFHALSGSFWLPVLIGESGSQPLDFSKATSDPPSDPRGTWLALTASAAETLTVTSTAAFPLTVETWSGDAHDVAELTQLAAGAGTVSAPLALGQRALVRAYPTTATDVGTATISWSVAPRPDSGTLSFITATEILETPGWLAAGVAYASPGATLEFTLDGAATVVFTSLVDDLGLAAADSVLLPQLTAGTHTITVTDPVSGQSASQDFTVDLVPEAPLAPGSDVSPTVDQTSIRWAFQDPAPGGETFVFPINPSEMSSPHFARNVTPDHTLAPSGQSIIWEGLPDPVSWQVRGSVETQAHYEALERFYALRRRFFVVDHLRRAWVVSFESLEFAKKRSTNDWTNDYTLKFLILAGPVTTS